LAIDDGSMLPRRDINGCRWIGDDLQGAGVSV
jgi:hypothetical protein